MEALATAEKMGEDRLTQAKGTLVSVYINTHTHTLCQESIHTQIIAHTEILYHLCYLDKHTITVMVMNHSTTLLIIHPMTLSGRHMPCLCKG